MDDFVAAPQNGVNVEIARDGLACAGNAPRLGQSLSRSKQRLRRHAAVKGALPADKVALDDRDVQPCLSEPACTHLSSGAGPDHDHVELVLVHIVSFLWLLNGIGVPHLFVPPRPPPLRQPSMLTARAATSTTVTIETHDWSSISSFTQRVSGSVSLGLNADAFVKETYR